MANELQYYGTPATETGLTVVARVYNDAGTQVGPAVSTTEVGSRAIYRGDMPSASVGEYGVRFFNGATLLGQGVILWDGTEEITLTDINADIDALNNLSTADINTALSGLNDLSAADVNAQVDAALADYDPPTNAELIAALGALSIPDPADVTAIKAKTDSLTFTQAGNVDANIKYVNDVEVAGTGADGDTWGPA